MSAGKHPSKINPIVPYLNYGWQKCSEYLVNQAKTIFCNGKHMQFKLKSTIADQHCLGQDCLAATSHILLNNSNITTDFPLKGTNLQVQKVASEPSL